MGIKGDPKGWKTGEKEIVKEIVKEGGSKKWGVSSGDEVISVNQSEDFLRTFLPGFW